MPQAKGGQKRAPGPGRPLRGDRKRVRVSFTLHPRDAEWLRGRAAAVGIAMSEMLNRVIEDARERLKQAEGPDRIGRSRVRILIPEKRVAEFCSRHHVRSLAVFGSALTDRFGPDSDIDLLVEFEDGREPGLFELAAMEEECGRMFGGRRVDLRTRPELSRFFRDEVVRDAEVIHGA